MDVSWWLLIFLAEVTRGSRDFEVTQDSRDVVVILNTLRPVTQISDKFLGISISPVQLVNVGEYSVAAVNMLQGLSPGYLRVGGRESDTLVFTALTNTSADFHLTESQWVKINQLAEDTGLHLVFSLSPRSQGQSQLLKYSDSREYDITWQLGYRTVDDNKTTEEHSIEFGQEVSNLRRLIDSFPRYQNKAVLSPDIEFCEDAKCLEANKAFFLQAKDAVDIVVFQLKPQENLKNTKNMFEKLGKLSQAIEISSFNKDIVFRKTKSSMKTNFWVAEAESGTPRGGMSEVMSCAMSLGLASRQGYHTYLLRLPHLSRPSPSYWAALLWRALVGRAVLGLRLWPQQTNVVVFAACTQTRPRPALDVEWEYDTGAVTLWGLNTANESTQLSLRTGSLLSHVHLYTLTGDPRDTGDILFNGRPLHMVHGVLPRLSPRVRMLSRGMSVTVPPLSVFYMVLPDTQAPACLISTGENFAIPLKKGDDSSIVRNILTLTSKGSPLLGEIGTKQGDIVFEKGGIFTDTSVNKNRFDNGIKTESKKDTLESITTMRDDGEDNIERKLEKSEDVFNKTEDLNLLNNFSTSITENNSTALINNDTVNPATLSRTNSGENFTNYDQDKLLVLKKNKNEILSKLSLRDKSHQSSNVNNTANKLNHALEAGVQRVKRSENYGYYDQISNTDTETSPLYRRVNLLRQILSKMQQQTQYEDEEQDKYFTDTGTLKTLHSNNKINPRKMSKIYSDYPVEVSSRRTNHKEQTSRVPVVQSKNVENINYLPGEFYEILGGLKLDSNTSLKDKEEIIEATDSFQKKSEAQTCNYSESKLTVTKKPENDPQEDRRLVEQATENSIQYYLSKNDTNEHKESKQKVEDYDKKRLINKWNKFPVLTPTEDIKKSNEKEELHSQNSFQNLKKKGNIENLIHSQFERTKREVYALKDIHPDFDQYLKLAQFNEEKLNKSDYPDEIELRRFLEELTNEGEQLLQTIDEEYKSNIGNTSYETGMKQNLTTESVPALDEGRPTISFGDDKVPTEDKSGESDFYLKNNILTDKEVKPKLNYHAQDEKNIDYSLTSESNKTAPNKDEDLKSQSNSTLESTLVSTTPQTDSSSTDEPSMATELTTLEHLKHTKNNITNTSMSVVINNSDAFIENVMPQTGKETNPGINLLSNNKPESSDNLLYTENIKIGNTSSKVSKIDEDIAKATEKTDSYSLPHNEEDEHESKYEPSFTRNTSDPITVTEQMFVREQLFDLNNSHANNTSGFPSTFYNMSTEHIEELEKVDDNKYKITDSDKQTKTVGISKLLTTPKMSDIVSTTAENIFDTKRKIDSENKLDNKILPPPSRPILNLLSVPSILTLNRNSSLPKAIDIINNRITEFNKKHKLSAPVLERSSLVNTTFSDKYKETLEKIKQRLQRARERFLNLTSSRTIQPIHTILKPPTTKREITMNMGKFNRLFSDQQNKEGTQSQTNLFYSTSEEANGSLLENHLSENIFPFHRLKRQIYEDTESESRSSEEKNPSQPENEENESENKRQPSPNIITPYYFSAIKKWVIPLSNSTENIFYKDRLFPVNLYGIVSDKWVREHMEKISNIEGRRQRRALNYPCVRDRFNDFEEEENSKTPWTSNVGNGKVSFTRGTKDLADSEMTKVGIIDPQKYYIRSRRAVNEEIEKNEIEMKALLTNEIVKEKPVNYVPDRENVFSSMLHKTLTKTATNKTGFERMFELAKQYHETNPSSLEIFSMKTKQNKNDLVKSHDNSDEENVAVEITEDVNGILTTNQVDVKEATTRNILMKGKGSINSSFIEKSSSDSKNTSYSSNEGFKSPDDLWSDFVNKIQEIFDDLTTEIRKGIW